MPSRVKVPSVKFTKVEVLRALVREFPVETSGIVIVDIDTLVFQNDELVVFLKEVPDVPTP